MEERNRSGSPCDANGSHVRQAGAWKDRCVVIFPRKEFIRSWIRAYFACGNTLPLVIATGNPGWSDEDFMFCRQAAEQTGGKVVDLASVWQAAKKLKKRSLDKRNPGWYTKKLVLHAIASTLAPKSWAWIDDDAEVTGDLSECFDLAEKSPGFVYTQYYYPGEIGNRHPSMMYRMFHSSDENADKLCWNSFVLFHGEANERMAEKLAADYPVEDDECVFTYLYKNDKAWHEGFCDYSAHCWQENCKTKEQIPDGGWGGKIVHYTSNAKGGEVKKLWAEKANVLPRAPFERSENGNAADEGPVDAVFVIGVGSVDENEELRYALRNLERNCPFVRDVYICGECPNWVDRSVVKHLQWPDRFRHAKDANIIDKLRHACEQPGIASRILFCSDDQFQTRVCAWGDFEPRYLRKYDSGDTWYANKKRVWHNRLRKTLEREVARRREYGLDPSNVFYFQPHMWMQINRDAFIAYAKWCGYEKRDDTIIASGYFNFAGIAGRPDFDHVFFTSSNSGVPKETHVAYHDGSYASVMKVLKDMFPVKSRFELHERSTDKKVVASGWDRPRTRDSSELKLDDPSPASKDELHEIMEVARRIRLVPSLAFMRGDLSRAEELRLYGVRGWRTVWRDLVKRYNEATSVTGRIPEPGCEMSDDARRVISDYKSRAEDANAHGVKADARTEVVSEKEREELHHRIRALKSRFAE